MHLVAASLTLDRGGRRIVDGLSFRVPVGEALVLTGPNGAGKTTLLRAVAGFLAPSSGSIGLEGADRDTTLAESCHYVGHASAVKAALTVAENADFWWRHLSDAALRKSEQDISRALDAFGLGDLRHVPAAYLSAGQKRRLGLARLLLAPRPVWLLDEPTTSLDTDSAARLVSIIDAHLAAEGLVIAATHQPLDLRRATTLKLGQPAGGEA